MPSSLAWISVIVPMEYLTHVVPNSCVTTPGSVSTYEFVDQGSGNCTGCHVRDWICFWPF
ncbi:hypothetical protein T05_16289 [Trichinella murrelli]|uniref:Uncharacterized protein n=1 Tax=Trichinella murrelli TaxID=144512 RepID=A0A0V0TVA0_9BILA|nr:hypothetical protein T05_16289 [Trichinella murrelli]